MGMISHVFTCNDEYAVNVNGKQQREYKIRVRKGRSKKGNKESVKTMLDSIVIKDLKNKINACIDFGSIYYPAWDEIVKIIETEIDGYKAISNANMAMARCRRNMR